MKNIKFKGLDLMTRWENPVPENAVMVNREPLAPIQKEIYDSLYYDLKRVEDFAVAYVCGKEEVVVKDLQEALSEHFENVDWNYCLKGTQNYMYLSFKVLRDRQDEPEVQQIIDRLESLNLLFEI